MHPNYIIHRKKPTQVNKKQNNNNKKTTTLKTGKPAKPATQRKGMNMIDTCVFFGKNIKIIMTPS